MEVSSLLCDYIHEWGSRKSCGRGVVDTDTVTHTPLAVVWSVEPANHIVACSDGIFTGGISSQCWEWKFYIGISGARVADKRWSSCYYAFVIPLTHSLKGPLLPTAILSLTCPYT